MTSRSRSLRAGQLRHICDIEQLSGDLDISGTPKANYVPFATGVFFSFDDARTRELLQAAQVGTNFTSVIIMRWRPGITTQMRLKHLTNPGESPAVFDYYDIAGITRDPTARFALMLMCTRRDNHGFLSGIPTI